jgi:hypothetical protein
MFLDTLAMNGVETDFEYTKMMAYSHPFGPFNTSLNRNGWRPGTTADFAHGRPAAGGRGVVTMAGAQVPHRDVRKYLKSLGRTMHQTVQSGAAR